MSTPLEKMSTRPLEKLPTPSEKISTRGPPKKSQPLSKKYHLYRKNVTPPEIILTPLKFLNPHPPKISQPSPQKISQPPPRKFLNPHQNFSIPPENFSTPLNISQPQSKKYQPQKYVKRYPPPLPNIPF